jgi:PAS domain S-box-containing protein
MNELQALLSASPDAVVVADGSGEIVRCNRHVEPVLGYPPDDLCGMAVESVLEPADRAAYRRFLEAYVADPEPRPMGTDLDLYATRADGERVPVELSLGPVEVDGETHVVATVTDVSKREAHPDAIPENETRYRRLLDVSPAPIVIYDAEGLVRYANEAAADLVALADSADVVGRPTADFIHPDDHEASREAVRRVLEDREPVESVERRIVADDGELRDVILSAVPITYEAGPAGQVLLSDVTPLKDRERALERQNDRLEQFAGIVSHDLRNPLTIIETSVDLARETGDAEHFDRAERAVDRMSTLVEDVLTMARYGRTPDSVEAVTLDRAAREAWQTVQTGNAELEIDAGDTVVAESNRLRELLENLFRNAVEHGDSGVTVRVCDTDDGFAVADDGPGIPPDERERVFERGYSTTEGGTGYGLAIVADLAEAHGWAVSVTESEFGGARFAIDTG